MKISQSYKRNCESCDKWIISSKPSGDCFECENLKIFQSYLDNWVEDENNQNLIKCPECESDKIYSHMVSVSAYATVNLNTWDVDEIDDAVFEDPDGVDTAVCSGCDYEWEVEVFVENGLYQYKMKGCE
jgi:hypothetical protein